MTSTSRLARCQSSTNDIGSKTKRKRQFCGHSPLVYHPNKGKCCFTESSHHSIINIWLLFSLAMFTAKHKLIREAHELYHNFQFSPPNESQIWLLFFGGEVCPFWFSKPTCSVDWKHQFFCTSSNFWQETFKTPEGWKFYTGTGTGNILGWKLEGGWIILCFCSFPVGPWHFNLALY